MFDRNTIWRSAFLLALVSTSGSLYFSEVLGFPPCVLCWYQRICMYPLVLILGVGLWKDDPRVGRYVRPLVLVGLVIAVYHNLLYYHIIPESIAPCTRGVSCTTHFIEYLGFITIPLLSMTSFILLTILSFVPKGVRHEHQ